MKQHKKTDKIIRKKVEHHASETPMHLFEGIMNALEEEAPMPEKNPWRRSWLLSLLALLLVGSGIWYAYDKSKTTNSTDEKLTASFESKNQNTATKENIKLENSNHKNGATETISSTNKTELSNTITSNSNIQNTVTKNITAEQSNISTITQGVSIDKNNNTFTNTNFSETIQSSSTKNTSNSSIFNSNENLTEKGGIIESTTSESQTTSGEAIIATENSTIETIDNSTTTTTVKNNNTIASQLSERESILFLPKLKSNQKLNRPQSNYKIDVEPICGLNPNGRKIRFTTSVDAFFSPDYASQILEYKTEDFKAHAEKRTKSESPYYSFNTGVRVNFLTEFDWALRIGLVYTQINDMLKTQHREIVTELNPTTGDTISITEGMRDVHLINKYKMVDIPITVGYEVPMKRFKLNLNGGVNVNLMSKQSGSFFSPLTDQIVSFTEGDSENPDNHNIFRNNIGLSFSLSVGFNFKLNKKTQLIVEPHTRFYPKSFTIKNYILNQKYLSTGVMLGVRRDL